MSKQQWEIATDQMVEAMDAEPKAAKAYVEFFELAKEVAPKENIGYAWHALAYVLLDAHTNPEPENPDPFLEACRRYVLAAAGVYECIVERLPVPDDLGEIEHE